MLVHTVELRVFVKEGEDFESVKSAFLSLFPFNLEEEKIPLSKSTALGLEGKSITILSAGLSKQRHVKLFLDSLLSRLSSEQKELLARQKESRLDEELTFFIRFDKTRLLSDATLCITDSGNCFHLKMSIAAFPSKRDAALAVIEKIFKVEA